MQWRELETFSFGDGPELADKLAALVLGGRKTATCWAASEGLKGIEIGKFMVVLDGARRPRAVIETMELTQRHFEEVVEQFAFDEARATGHSLSGDEHTAATSPATANSRRTCFCGASAFGLSRSARPDPAA
jgi:uncharacterized protein YhfF